MTTPILELPEWQQNQNQPHITVNEALRILDCLVQLTVLDRTLTAPPGSPPDPVEGDCYIPASPASDEWVGRENDVAMFIGGAWVFRSPRDGWEAWDIAAQERIRFSEGSPGAWSAV